MIVKDKIESYHFKTSFKIHGRLCHTEFPDDCIRWYIYCIEDFPCHRQIIGSTSNPADRWRNYKSTCNSKKSNSTGLSKHFKDGCPFDPGKEKETLIMTLIDFYDTTLEKLTSVKHEPGPHCRCVECENLKHLEDFWILKMGTLSQHGFNTHDQIIAKTRFQTK